jgi:hypothetical protein
MKMKILQNQVRCNNCGDEPFSAHTHDFKYCKCGAVGVDGGMAYLRRIGEPANYTEMSLHMGEDVVEECIEAVKWATDTGRNELGTFLAILRVLRKHNFLKEEKV